MQDSAWEEYYAAALTAPAVVDALERVLARNIANGELSLDDVRAGIPAGCNYDQVIGVLGAFVRLGIVSENVKHVYRVSESAFGASLSQRRRAREAIGWAAKRTPHTFGDLLLSAPAAGKTQAGFAFERDFADLRTSLRALVASARVSLLLASPYWDREVAADLGSLFERRLEAGISVRLLARRAPVGSPSADALRLIHAVLQRRASCEIRVLEEPSRLDPFGAATFHFKMAAADGERVYIGSANFNTAGLASRWELGVLLTGRHAEDVAGLVSALFESARPYEAG